VKSPWLGNGFRLDAIWLGRAVGWTFPWPSSNWWIKTARCEDNEVEATMTVRLSRCRPVH